MQSAGWYIRRLQSMGPAEIAWRIRGLLRDQLDLVRIPLGLTPRPDFSTTLFEDFEPGFRCSPIGPGDWDTHDHANIDAWRTRLVAKAKPLLENRLSYFDLEHVDHGTPVNWHRDHSAGMDAPIRLSILTDYRDFSTYGDCKLVWEPNRHHHLVVLARAYVATGESRYAEKVAEQLRSWIDANPFGYGMNWKSVLEHGVRLINWVWALDLIRESGAIDADLWKAIKRTVYLLAWDAQRKFSQGSSANNHLIGEVAGVYIACCYFPDMPHAAAWRDKSQAILEREIIAQTYADGCTREHTFGYEFFVIQFFLYSLQAGDKAGYPFSSGYRDRLHAMYRFMDEVAAATGQVPNINDRDDGYVLDLGEQPAGARQLNSVGGLEFDDTSLLSCNDSETVFWLYGVADQRYDFQVRDSVCFRESGYSILRNSSASIFFDHAELGYGPIAAHGHADCLSILVAVEGQALFTDAGTYDYFTHPEWRNHFRRTRAHNTAEIDGRDQSDMQGAFLWGRRARPTLLEWTSDDSHAAVCAQHDGYTALADPVIHRRRVELAHDQSRISIRDTFECEGKHEVQLHFHLDPHCRVIECKEGTVTISLNHTIIRMHAENAEIKVFEPSGTQPLGWISDGYHRKSRSSCIRIELPINGDSSHKTVIEWTA